MLKIRDWVGIAIDALRGVDNAKLSRENDKLKDKIASLETQEDVRNARNKIPEKKIEDPENEKYRHQENLERVLSPDGKSTIDRLVEGIKKSKKQ